MHWLPHLQLTYLAHVQPNHASVSWRTKSLPKIGQTFPLAGVGEARGGLGEKAAAAAAANRRFRKVVMLSMM